VSLADVLVAIAGAFFAIAVWASLRVHSAESDRQHRQDERMRRRERQSGGVDDNL
jgi:hypothetical protein